MNRSSTKPRCVGGYSLISVYIYIQQYNIYIYIQIYVILCIYYIYIHVIVILGMDHQPAVAISMAQVQTLGGHRREQLVRRWHARGPSGPSGPSDPTRRSAELDDIWVNYNELTVLPHWKSWLVREIIPKFSLIQVSEL